MSIAGTDRTGSFGYAPYNLRKLGFAASAVHNNDGTFYERNKVFSNLGFERFDSLEYMRKVEFTLHPLSPTDPATELA